MAKENEYAPDYSTDELLACFLARDFEDGMEIATGVGMPVIRAAVYLAALSRCPNTRIRMAGTYTNILNVGPVGPFEFDYDIRAARWAEAYVPDEDDSSWEARLMVRHGYFFVGALQIDKYGNGNLIGIGDDYKKLKLRGPGGIGAPTISSQQKHYYIQVNRHDRRTFVEKCDYISHIGWDKGGEDARKKLGMPGGGPKYVLTPLCIMDFEEHTKRMRLKYVHPGVTKEEVIENTGFELIVPEKVPTTPPPTKEEIALIRTKIDREGELRK